MRAKEESKAYQYVRAYISLGIALSPVLRRRSTAYLDRRDLTSPRKHLERWNSSGRMVAFKPVPPQPCGMNRSLCFSKDVSRTCRQIFHGLGGKAAAIVLAALTPTLYCVLGASLLADPPKTSGVGTHVFPWCLHHLRCQRRADVDSSVENWSNAVGNATAIFRCSLFFLTLSTLPQLAVNLIVDHILRMSAHPCAILMQSCAYSQLQVSRPPCLVARAHLFTNRISATGTSCLIRPSDRITSRDPSGLRCATSPEMYAFVPAGAPTGVHRASTLSPTR